ncbi:hypothetical protein [Vibrio harveyi]|uniref:hypothetical protein n=1 Tax=Vibrio harveyi TaxID=669 RepID=UPI00028D34B9|nr:hypothetical protein VCHENC01_0967 [Vibrio harveyi]HEQ3608451.1 hypothetical protein [Vibrio harveyi]
MRTRFLTATLIILGTLPFSYASSTQIDGLIRPGEPILWIDEDPDPYIVKIPWNRSPSYSGTSAKNWCVGAGTYGNNGGINKSVKLSGPDGASVSMELRYIATEWKLKSVPDSTFSSPQGGKQELTMYGDVANVKNDGMTWSSETCFKYELAVAPISLFRPVIELDPSNIAYVSQQFDEGKLPSGTYLGSVSLPTIVWSTDRFGNWFYRHSLSADVLFYLEYQADRIAQIRVEGSDNIIPDTWTTPGMVHGKTVYTTHIEGIVSNGVKVSLASPDSDYSLNPVNTPESETNKIPFNVFCRECEGTGVTIIENGRALSASSYYSLLDNNFREVVATFEVSYRDKSLDELYNDTYLGSFTLLFELGM